jgi:uncharacterized protein YceK|tara:strand:+ start:1033 stop:1299 length:267 start_codon:yes stop_codon:yes gene_type:complete
MKMIMKDKNVIKTKMGKVQAIGLSLVYLLVMLYLLSGCGSSHSIPSEGCCSHTGVKDTSVQDTKVNLDLVKKDGVVIILPTLTKDTIK